MQAKLSYYLSYNFEIIDIMYYYSYTFLRTSIELSSMESCFKYIK